MFSHSGFIAQRLRPLLAGACALAWFMHPSAASARGLVPEKPSVEVNLEVLQNLQAGGQLQRPTPAGPGGLPSPQTLTRSLGTAAPSERKVPREQPVPGYRLPRAMTPPAPATQPNTLGMPDVSSTTGYVVDTREQPEEKPAAIAPARKEKKSRKERAKKKAEPVAQAAPAAAPPAPDALPKLTAITTAPEKPAAKPMLPAVDKGDLPIVTSPPPSKKPIPIPAPLTEEKPPAAPAAVAAPAAPAQPTAATPDVSKLDFSKMPAPPSKISTAPMLVPVPKDPPALPPTVENRLKNLSPLANTDKEGIISDKTTVKDPSTDIAKQIQTEKDKPTQPAAPVVAPTAEMPKDTPRPAAPPVIPALDMKKPEAVAAGAVASKKPSAEKLPPAELPLTPPTPKPAPVAKIAPVEQPEKHTLSLPKKTPAGVDKLPALTPIIGDQKPDALEAVQSKNVIEAKPLAPASPAVAAAPVTPPTLPPVAVENKNLPVVKREEPPARTTSDADKKPAAPVVTPPAPIPAPAPVVAEKPVAAPKPVEQKPVAESKAKPAAAEIKASENTPPPLAPVLPAAPAAITPPAKAAPVAEAAPSPTAVDANAKPAHSVKFDKDKTDLSDDAKSELNAIAEKAKDAQSGLRIVAYASGTPEQASVARRMSLSRALQVRAFLIGKGVNQLSINVQALGNQTTGSNADRADIFIK